jgi:hypothetical protein
MAKTNLTRVAGGSTSHKSSVATPSMNPRAKQAVDTACSHKRMVDEVLSTEGKKTGRVRCLECHAEFDPSSSIVDDSGTLQ